MLQATVQYSVYSVSVPTGHTCLSVQFMYSYLYTCIVRLITLLVKFTFNRSSSFYNVCNIVLKLAVIPLHIKYFILFTGSPNCPILHTTVKTTSLAVSIHKSPMKWLQELYSVEVTSYNESIATVVSNSTLKGLTSFNVASLQPGTVYNISVIPCNMAGCNESCDIHLVNTENAETAGTRGEMRAHHTQFWASVKSYTHICISHIAIVGARHRNQYFDYHDYKTIIFINIEHVCMLCVSVLSLLYIL